MSHDDNRDKIDRFARGIIRRKVKQLVGRAGFKQQDREDLEQELILRLLQALPSFNPKKAHRNAFVTTVIERAVASILRDKQAEKRDHRRVSSLFVLIDTPCGPTELASTISQAEYDARRGRCPRSLEEMAQLIRDVADLMARLPPDLRDLAEPLMTQSKSEIARELDTPRTTLNEWVRRIRRRFERAGLKDYV
ncbi:MAG: sigma-70 family RNA polymerase sigma factor [Planctomycetia bacterium]|nr:sigma-70 family RNA polymerase sigma factor [Planctomycetia bacterium]